MEAWKQQVFELFGTTEENGQIRVVQPDFEEDERISINDTTKILALSWADVENYVQLLQAYLGEVNNFDFDNEASRARTFGVFSDYVYGIESMQESWPVKVFNCDQASKTITMDIEQIKEVPLIAPLAFFALDNSHRSEMPALPFWSDYC